MSLPRSAILAWHRRRYPLLRAQDIYKLVHQGVFGPGHIITSAAQAKRMLEEELAALQTRSPKFEGRTVRQGSLRPMSESEFEPLDPKNRLVRVNLRPMLGPWGQSPCGDSPRGAVEWLAETLVESARRVKGDPAQMIRRLAGAVRWCRTNLPLQAAGLERMAAQAGASGFPAFHHSPAYKRAYRPAYRVVLSGCLKPRASGRAG